MPQSGATHPAQPGWIGILYREGMARLEGNSSNALFETLQDWEHQLKHSEIDFQAISRKPKGPQL